MGKVKLKQALVKSAKTLYSAAPVLVGVILLVSLVNTLIPKSIYSVLFSKNLLLDSFIGGAIGSVLAGTPITSYVVGGELLAQGISLIAVTAFMVTWVTVGIVQLPAEIMLLGKRFAITRNIVSFVFAIIIAIITVTILGVI